MFVYCNDNPVNSVDLDGKLTDDKLMENANKRTQLGWEFYSISPAECVQAVQEPIYRSDPNNLYRERRTKTVLSSKESVQQYYKTISFRDYEEIADNINAILNFANLGKIGDLIRNFCSLSSITSKDSIVRDSSGRILYLEINYTVVSTQRVYIWDNGSSFETQYTVFDDSGTCVFNKCIGMDYRGN